MVLRALWTFTFSGKDCSMEQMTGIREQQEHLARLHFELGAQQELFAPLSDEGLRQGTENMHSLMSKLEKLSISIEKLHSFSSSLQDWFLPLLWWYRQLVTGVSRKYARLCTRWHRLDGFGIFSTLYLNVRGWLIPCKEKWVATSMGCVMKVS